MYTRHTELDLGGFLMVNFESLNWQDFFPNRDFLDNLKKWGLFYSLKLFSVSYTTTENLRNEKDLLSQLLNDGNFWRAINVNPVLIKHKEATYTELKVTQLELDFFKKIRENPFLVRENGDIVKCFDEYTNTGIVISDELRKILLLKDSEHFDLLSNSDRSEFLFQLFTLFCLGGNLCQYEDEIDPYLTVSKAAFDFLITKQKDCLSSGSKVVSKVFQVEIPSESMINWDPRNVCFIITNEINFNTATVLYQNEASYM